MLKITLPGGVVREVEPGTTLDALCRDISMGLYRNACAAYVNGKVADLRNELTEDCEVAILTFDDLDGRKAYWHTVSHVMAQAIKRLYPDVKLAIGPSIDEGFYYDIDADFSITPEVLEAIEGETYDTIYANINRNIILGDIARYTAALNAGGILYVSGFLSEDVEHITSAAAAHGLNLTTQLEEEGWVAIAFHKAQ